MEIYNVGDCNLQDYELKYCKGFDWIVYSYNIDGYDGSGYLVAGFEGRLYEITISHCSCYGPIDSEFTPQNSSEVPISDVFGDNRSIFAEDYETPVRAKVAELLGLKDANI